MTQTPLWLWPWQLCLHSIVAGTGFVKAHTSWWSHQLGPGPK
jgi:hypothetical protein